MFFLFFFVFVFVYSKNCFNPLFLFDETAKSMLQGSGWLINSASMLVAAAGSSRCWKRKWNGRRFGFFALTSLFRHRPTFAAPIGSRLFGLISAATSVLFFLLWWAKNLDSAALHWTGHSYLLSYIYSSSCPFNYSRWKATKAKANR